MGAKEIVNSLVESVLHENDEHPLSKILLSKGYSKGETSRSYANVYDTYHRPDTISTTSTQRSVSAIPDSTGKYSSMSSTRYGTRTSNHTIEIHKSSNDTRWHYYKPGKIPHTKDGGEDRYGETSSELEKYLNRIHK